jgi:ligand-binding sensor domain-containing protein
MTSIRQLCCGLLGLVLGVVPVARGQAPSFADYTHTAWTASDGAPVHVRRLAQTPDGWLWLGTPHGLYRFDGVRFHPFAAANGARLLSARIWELAPQADGDLYIGYDGPGLSLLHADGRLEHLAPATQDGPVAQINDVIRDRDGSLWAATNFGLRRFKDGSWSKLGQAQACPDMPLWAALDRGGQLWAATWRQLYRVDRATGQCIPTALPASPRGQPEKMVGFHTSPDGRLWVGGDGRLALVSAPPPGATATTAYHAPRSASLSVFDRSGNLWALRCPAGVCLAGAAGASAGREIDVAAATTDRLDQRGQLGSLAPRVIVEDREGDIWLGSPTGIERFRRKLLRPVDLPAIKGDYHVAPDLDGSVWVVAPQELRGWRYDPATRRLTRLPGKYRGATLGPKGVVVLLRDDGITLRHAGGETRIPLPQPRPLGAWARSDGERVWLGGFKVPVQLWDGQGWKPLAPSAGAEFVFSAPGNRGQMWRGLADGRLVLFEGDGYAPNTRRPPSAVSVRQAACRRRPSLSSAARRAWPCCTRAASGACACSAMRCCAKSAAYS